MSVDPGITATLIRQVVANALNQGSQGGLSGLPLGSFVFMEASGMPAGAVQVQALRELIQEVAADGVLTEAEIATIGRFLAAKGLRLALPELAPAAVDLDAIELP